MALTPEQRIALLNRAVRLESRSFLEYVALTAPPIDIAKYPTVARQFAEIAHEEDQVVDDLVEMMAEQGGHPDALGSYDLGFTSYNYVTTDYALKIIGQQLAKNLARFDEILEQARGDELEEKLATIRASKALQVARAEEMKAGLKKPGGGAAPPHAPPHAPPAPGAHAH